MENFHGQFMTKSDIVVRYPRVTRIHESYYITSCVAEAVVRNEVECRMHLNLTPYAKCRQLQSGKTIPAKSPSGSQREVIPSADTPQIRGRCVAGHSTILRLDGVPHPYWRVHLGHRFVLHGGIEYRLVHLICAVPMCKWGIGDSIRGPISEFAGE